MRGYLSSPSGSAGELTAAAIMLLYYRALRCVGTKGMDCQAANTNGRRLGRPEGTNIVGGYVPPLQGNVKKRPTNIIGSVGGVGEDSAGSHRQWDLRVLTHAVHERVGTVRAETGSGPLSG